jgi:hypothetical protein
MTSIQVAFAVAFAGYLALATIVVAVSLASAPAELDARVRTQRDDAGKALTDMLGKAALQADLAAGLDAFRHRLEEGNQLAKALNDRMPRVELSERVAARASWKADREASVRAWKVACRDTARAYLPHRAPLFDSPLPTLPRAPGSGEPWLLSLRAEVQERIHRVAELQRELESSVRAIR